MKKGFFLAIALSILLIPALLSAQGSRAPQMMCKQETQLSDEQKTKLTESMMECRMAGIELGAELEILEIKMNSEFMKDEPSRKVLMDLAAKISATKEKLQKQHIDHMLMMKSTMGPDHWKKGMNCCCGMGGGRSMGAGGCCGGGGHAVMGKGCCGGGCGTAVMGMGGSGCGCCGGGCGTGGKAVMGRGCCDADRCGRGTGHGCACMSGCASGAGKRIMMKKECSHMCGGHSMGLAPWPSGSCCPGGMKKMQGCTQGQSVEKVIERRCVEKSSEK